MQITQSSSSHLTPPVADEAGHTAEFNLFAYGLSSSTPVPRGNVTEIQRLLDLHFDGVKFTNPHVALSTPQFEAAMSLNRLGALDDSTLHTLLDRRVLPQTIEPAESARDGDGEAGSASGDAPGSHRSHDEAQELAERGERRPAAGRGGAGAPSVSDAGGETGRGARIRGALSAASQAVFEAVPRATPVLMDVVCLGLSVPVAAMAIKQALEESHKPSHDDKLLFMKATLPTVVAVNSLRNLIKYGTDGRRV